jgi:hypothetical protein
VGVLPVDLRILVLRRRRQARARQVRVEDAASRSAGYLEVVDPLRTSGSRKRRIRPALEPLVRQLSELPALERREVVAAAEETATQRPVLSWESWESACNAVRLGGNAVEDCDRLYDGS